MKEIDDNKKIAKPKIFLVLKIFGPILFAAGIAMVVIGFNGFGDFSVGYPFLNVFGMFALFLGISFTVWGFTPEISKLNARATRYIAHNNKEEIKDIADVKADISDEAITKVAKAVKKGIKDTKFCKECGKEIDSDAKYCKDCGTKQ